MRRLSLTFLALIWTLASPWSPVHAQTPSERALQERVSARDRLAATLREGEHEAFRVEWRSERETFTGTIETGGPDAHLSVVLSNVTGTGGSFRGSGRRIAGTLEIDASGPAQGVAGAVAGVAGSGRRCRVACHRRPDGGLDGTYTVKGNGGNDVAAGRISGTRDARASATPVDLTALESEIELLKARSRRGPRVVLTISCDWEGRAVEPALATLMSDFRDAFPNVPITHFLNAAYFTKPGAKPAEVVAKIQRALRGRDELGLHIHCWKSLVTSAGVPFRKGPSYWDGKDVLDLGLGDVGHDVQLTAYTEDEVRALVRTSVGILRDQGFAIGTSFRAGGWLADQKVLAAIRAEGFTADSSSVDAKWHKEEIGDTDLAKKLRVLWPDVTEATPPFFVVTPFGSVLEMPDTGALADYVTPDEMVGHLRRALERAKADPTRDVFAHLGFHHESSRYLSRLADALRQVAGAREIEHMTLSEAARFARVQLPLADR